MKNDIKLRDNLHKILNSYYLQNMDSVFFVINKKTQGKLCKPNW